VIAPRWRVLAALFAVTATVSSAVAAFGVFLPVLTDTFGWSRGAVSVALSINLMWGGLMAFVVGRLADRRGPRGVLLATVLIGALGFALTSRIGELWHFYVTYGLLVGLGFSSVYVLTTATVSRWFTERRGLALAIVLSGFNLGWLVGGPLAALLIARWGWRSAYVGLAGLLVTVAAPSSLAVRYPAEARPLTGAPGRRPSGSPASARASLGHALGDRRLWYLAAAWFLLGMVFMMVSVHSVPYGRDRGLPLEQASLLLTAYGIGAAVGRLAAGVAADRLGTLVTMRYCLLIQGTALAVLVAGPPAWALIPALVAFGLGAAGSDNTFVKVIPEVFGLAALATLMSVVGLGWRIGGGLGPAAAGYLHDATRSYTLAFGAGVVALVAALVLFRLGAATHAR
jgi:MFS family permease